MSIGAVTNEILLETLQHIQNDVSVMRRDLQKLQSTVEAMEREPRKNAGLELQDKPRSTNSMNKFQPFGVPWHEWLFVIAVVLFAMWFGANIL